MILPFLTTAIDLLMGAILKASATKRLQQAAKDTAAPLPDGMGTTAAYMAGRTDEQRKTQMQTYMEEMTGDARKKLGGDDA